MTEGKGVSQWLDFAAISAAIGAMLAWTWRTWPDPLVDYGRELYIAWQISLGHTLYIDDAYFDGPLAPYANGFLMKMFGANLSTVLFANFVIFLVVITLLYLLIERMSDRITAVVGCLVIIGISGFGRLTVGGNYNMMAPYSHQFTYGFTLGLGALAILFLPKNFREPHAACAGVLLGLVLLTKVEFAFASLLAVAVGYAMRVRTERDFSQLKSTSLFFCGVIAPPLMTLVLLSFWMPRSDALRGTLGSMYWVVSSRISSLPFYRGGIGLTDLRQNLQLMLTGLLLIAVAIGLAWASGYFASKFLGAERSKAASGIAFLTITIMLLPALGSTQWFASLPKALPLVSLALLAASVATYLRTKTCSFSNVSALRSAFSLYALALLGKMILNVRLYHYGFVLAVPALVLTICALVSWIPEIAAKRGADLKVVRAVGLAFLLQLSVVYIGSMVQPIRQQRYVVGTGTNKFMADERGLESQRMLDFMAQNMPANATLAVLPEGAMMNFISHHNNPTPHSTFMPAEMLVFGEDRMLDSLKACPPDYLILAHRDTSEFGVPLFGRDYGKQIGVWIRENYVPVVKAGEVPLQDPDVFGILLLKRVKPI